MSCRVSGAQLTGPKLVPPFLWGPKDAMNALASHRADINARATNGATPLSIAAATGEFSVSRSQAAKQVTATLQTYQAIPSGND